ncbi:MAG: cell division protein FtsZ [Bryobacterales bacterium]|nr:cell division protein FtsZ [Bryobacteraceae bacterium]MDW8356021.1 cell division protein FtsZ [Bryobacterales bacterium]
MEAQGNGLKFELHEEAPRGTRFKVIGVGGGGSNAVGRMMSGGLEGVEFCVVNTDAQALRASAVPYKLQIGEKLTRGLGAGADPEIGRQAALDDTERITEMLQDAEMVFLVAALGCGTGTGAAPVIATLAKGLGALTVAVVTMPFRFEGPRRMQNAERGLAELAATVDAWVPLYNDRLLALAPPGISLGEAFRLADDVVRQAVEGISDIILRPGLINRDFADLRATLQGMGFAVMGTAVARGEKAALEAARQAIRSPLIEEGGIAGAASVLVNITGSQALGLHDVSEACQFIREATGREDAVVNFGLALNDAMGDAVKVTVIATGFSRETAPVGSPAPIAAVSRPEPGPASRAEAPPVSPLEASLPEPEDLDVPAYLRQRKLIQ